MPTKIIFSPYEINLMIAIVGGLDAERYMTARAKSLIYKCLSTLEEGNDVTIVVRSDS